MKKFVIHKPNKIKYGQDMTFYRGLPIGVEFSVSRFNGGYVLKADGYGNPTPNYGNGAIYLYKTKDLSKHYIKKLEDACGDNRVKYWAKRKRYQKTYRIWDELNSKWWTDKSGKSIWINIKVASKLAEENHKNLVEYRPI
jgi:hypothetical protein